jgi:NIPSNAP
MRLPALFRMITFLLLLSVSVKVKAKTNTEFYRLETWYFSSPQQEAQLDDYLKNAYLPALHGYGLKHIGVFKPIANDTATVKSVYILIAFSSLKQVQEIAEKLQTNQDYMARGAAFLSAPFDAPAFNRKEVTLLKAFSKAPNMVLPALAAPLAERVYELRSYESPSDNLYRNKVHMFNEGGEVALFKRLGFNAVFYGDVIAGPRMPNLMYITCFNNMSDRNAHWDTFRNDPEWKSLSGNPFYQHNVSKADIILTRPAPYSDY